MANITGILESIRTIVAGVTGVGRVYAYRRWLPQDRDFQLAAVTGNKVNIWEVIRANTEERWLNKFQFQRIHQITIRGFYSSKDASASEQTFQQIVDRLQRRFHLQANRTLGNTVESLGQGDRAGLQIQSTDYAQAHNALCHSLNARLLVIEKPETVLTIGATLTTFTGPRIFYVNSIGASAQITPSSTNPSFPRTYLIDEAPKTPWRSQNLGSPSVTIDIDLGSATTIRALAIKNHNFSAGTYRLYHGATNPATNVVTLSTIVSGNWLSFFATRTSRYWRFSMREAAIASGFYQIGELWLGNVVDLSKWHAGNSSETLDSGVKQHETDGGVRWRLSGFHRESRSYRFEGVTAGGDWTIWRRVFDSRGREHPFFYIVNPAVPSSAFFCVFAGALKEQQSGDNRLNIDITLDEEL